VRRLPLELVLAGAVAAILTLEAARGDEPVGGSVLWPLLQAATAGAALGVAARRRDELRLPSVLGLSLALTTGWIGAHLALGVPSDFDSGVIYQSQGETLLSGHYPPSEYPPGAVLLFAFETLVGGGSARVSNAFAMVPFHLVTVWAIWQLRTAWAPWFATLVALWPLNVFHVEMKFDALPTACLAVGLLLAWRGRWTLAGAALGIGAGVKWTPGLAAVALAVWLVASRRPREALRLGGAATAVFLLIHLPFFAANPSAVLHAYTSQGGRGIIGESLVYLPLRALHVVSPVEVPWLTADAPAWATAAAIAVQAIAVLAVLAGLVAVRGDPGAALALAAALPVAFLLTNRVFSPQFTVTLFACCAVAGAVVARSLSRVGLLAILVAAAGIFNALVYPVVWSRWPWASAGLFAVGLAATGWIVAWGISSVGDRRTDLLSTIAANHTITGMTGKSMRG
jgi:hypothetical protein